MSLRGIMTMFCAGILASLFVLPATGGAQTLKVTLLGTGTPNLAIERFGPATLVQADKENFLFDCGRGAAQRIWQLKIPLGHVPRLFLTHLHSDHVNGIPDFWLTGWLAVRYAGRKTPLQVWGPKGTKEMMSYLEKAFQADRHIRIEDEKLSPEVFPAVTYEIKEGVVYDNNGVRITAFLVDHFPGEDPEPCFGYRIDYAGRSVVISGDTRYSENLIKFSKGVDVLIHEVAGAKEELLKTSVATQRIIDHHVSPEEAGKVFSQVKPKLAVFTHFVLVASNEISAPTVQELVTMTRKTYSGPLEAGEDLMTIEIGDTVKVTRPSR